MNKTAYESLPGVYQPGILYIEASQVSAENARTLLWGYTCDRESHHVYAKDGLIHVLVYRGVKTPILNSPLTVLHHQSGTTLPALGLIPNKRLYPEACDEQTCRILLGMGIRLPFTTFRDDRPAAQYHGLLLEDFPDPVETSTPA